MTYHAALALPDEEEAMTARQLRNRVITILDRDDSMTDTDVVEEEATAAGIGMTGLVQLPAIMLTQGEESFLMIVMKMKPDA